MYSSHADINSDQGIFMIGLYIEFELNDLQIHLQNYSKFGDGSCKAFKCQFPDWRRAVLCVTNFFFPDFAFFQYDWDLIIKQRALNCY